MKTVLLALALAFGFAGVSYSQQMDGKNCEFAYKKLQQHRINGVCNEDSSRSDNTPADDKVENSAPKGDNFFDRVSGF